MLSTQLIILNYPVKDMVYHSFFWQFFLNFSSQTILKTDSKDTIGKILKCTEVFTKRYSFFSLPKCEQPIMI